MVRLLFEVSYDGSKYDGWASQKHTKNTIQEIIETNIEKVLNTDRHVKIYGSGRTDKGVHAYRQYFHVDINKLSFEFYKLKTILNKLLPKSIYINYVWDIPKHAHARYDVINKTYLYKIRIDNRRPFNNNLFWDLKESEFNYSAFIKIKKQFLGEHNFMSYFASISKSTTKDFVRTIEKIYVKKYNNEYHIYITGTGFGRYMVRLMVGTMVKYGQGKISDTYIAKTISSPSEKYNVFKAPASGLYLYNVVYKKNINDLN